ncbi:MAG: amidohydrolase [Acidobacteriota bacterium]|nr:amidohydrolase [Acidobacteriota bacterium]MDH3522811.1 amidohydrolase [Acidobacteriota bacterium]
MQARRMVGALFLVALAAAGPAVGEPRHADLLIVNGHLVTMDGEFRVIEDGTVAVEGSRIVGVGGPELAGLFAAEETIDAGGDLVMPGMVNTHTHASMTIFRGLGDDVPDRLRRFIFPLEAAVVDADHVFKGALLGAVEMVLGGATTFVDMYYFEDAVARAARAVGVRAVLGETIIGFPAPDAEIPYGGLDYARRFIAEFAGDELVTPALAPHAPYTMDREHLELVAAAARELDVPVLVHLAETRAEIEQIEREHGLSPVEYLDAVGLLSDRLVAAHCIFVDAADIELLRERGVGVSHNIVSNVKAGKGVAPVLAMRAAGLDVGLGTDGPMSGNTLDMMGLLGYTAKLHKLAQLDRSVMPARDVVEMATIGGARAIDMEDRIGSLEVGKLADLLIVDVDSVHMIPMYDVYSALVYAAGAQDVRTVIVHGRQVVRDRELLTVDVERLKADVRELTDEIARQAARL